MLVERSHLANTVEFLNEKFSNVLLRNRLQALSIAMNKKKISNRYQSFGSSQQQQVISKQREDPCSVQIFRKSANNSARNSPKLELASVPRSRFKNKQICQSV
mmetsp:Transcript_26450/g.30579  ORF Transcript_26450/g.30579 Transcript_26450/m.30579 type:complete len:103 (+) Transcript_26450:215-523(+)